MKKILVMISVIASVVAISCKTQVEPTAQFAASKGDFSATASSRSISVTQADSATTVLTLDWTDPKYAVGLTNSLFTVFVAPSNTNFVSFQTKSFTGVLTGNILAKEMNQMALQLGAIVEQSISLDVKVVASQENNNEPRTSNLITITVVPYSSKPVPKFPVPDSLYIVGGATPGAWSNPVSWPSQKLTKIDDYTFGAILQLSAAGTYDFLPVNGDWTNKYNVADGTSANPMGDSFQAVSSGGSDIPGPATAGLYKIIVDFISGTYKLTALSSNPIPDSLYIVGGATPGAWSNPVAPSQKLKKVSNGDFQLTLALTAGQAYDYLPVNGDWTNKFNVASSTADPLNDTFQGVTGGGSDIPAPATSGTYLIDVNFFTMKYTLTKQ